MCVKLLTVAGLLFIGHAAELKQNSVANPVRKVVTMLQMMSTKIEAEGEKEHQLFEKFMCYCKNGAGDLEKSIADAEDKVSQASSGVKELEGKLAQNQAELKDHKADRVEAERAIAEAKAIREKQAADFAKEKGDGDTNLAALDKAIAALEKGMAGAFLQTSAAQLVRGLVQQQGSLTDFDRQELMSFLSSTEGSGYAPASGEIVGILKQMRDTMAGDTGDLVAGEEAAIKSFNGLLSSNEKVLAASTAAIETKTERVGDLKVDLVNLKGDKADTFDALAEDKKFLAGLGASCKTKEGEYEVRVKTRKEEILALSETIKVLNDDDALELFKKTLPSASASFVQIEVSSSSVTARAQALLHAMRKKCTSGCVRIDLISMALHGKAVNFDKVVGMVDEMVTLLLHEQSTDNEKKEYCGAEFDRTDDEKKAIERSVSDLETAITDAEDSIATLGSDIEALAAGIKALDKMVSDATANRQEGNSNYKQLMAQDTAAKKLLNFAKNRLNQFYNPKLYVAPAKRELSSGDRIYENLGGDIPTEAPGGIANTGITVLAQDAPAPPPETWGAYNKKSGDSTGVMQMIDLLIADLDKELTEAKVEEENSQTDYEALMADSAEKHASDAKLLAEKEAMKSEAGASLLKMNEDKSTAGEKLMATKKVIHSLHQECDWLLQNFDARKEARNGEVDSLKNAKAILNGADYSLIQTNTRTLLRKQR